MPSRATTTSAKTQARLSINMPSRSSAYGQTPSSKQEDVRRREVARRQVLVRYLGVRPVRPPEGELVREPGLERRVELLVVALLVCGRRDPPADVDVGVDQLLGQLGAASHRIQVGAADVLTAVLVEDIA